jgi:putative lipoprotein
MRKVMGFVMLPLDAPETRAGLTLIEVRDVSLLDAPSVVIAEERLVDVRLEPGGAIPFSVDTPEVEATQSLSLRVHISVDGSGRVQKGDLLTTMHYPVPDRGTPRPMQVLVQVI